MFRGTNKYRGIARNVEWREKLEWTSGSQSYHLTVLTFRIEQINDKTGETLAFIPVELSGQRIRGSVVDGDEVEVIGKMTNVGILEPSFITNLRTNMQIASYRPPIPLILIGLFLFIASFVLTFGFLAFQFVYQQWQKMESEMQHSALPSSLVQFDKDIKSAF